MDVRSATASVTVTVLGTVNSPCPSTAGTRVHAVHLPEPLAGRELLHGRVDG